MFRLIGLILGHVAVGTAVAYAGFKTATSKVAAVVHRKYTANREARKELGGFKTIVSVLPGMVLAATGAQLFIVGLMFAAPAFAGVGMALVFLSPVVIAYGLNTMCNFNKPDSDTVAA